METIKKYLGYIFGAIGAIIGVLFFYQKNKIADLEKDAILAKTDKVDAVLGAKQEAIIEKKLAITNEMKADKPDSAKDLSDSEIEDHWNSKKYH